MQVLILKSYSGLDWLVWTSERTSYMSPILNLAGNY